MNVSIKYLTEKNITLEEKKTLYNILKDSKEGIFNIMNTQITSKGDLLIFIENEDLLLIIVDMLDALNLEFDYKITQGKTYISF